MDKNKDKKWLSLWISKDVHKDFKTACASQSIQMNTCILLLLEDFISSAKNEKKGRYDL